VHITEDPTPRKSPLSAYKRTKRPPCRASGDRALGRNDALIRGPHQGARSGLHRASARGTTRRRGPKLRPAHSAAGVGVGTQAGGLACEQYLSQQPPAMQQFIDGTIWYADRTALDAVARGIAAESPAEAAGATTTVAGVTAGAVAAQVDVSTTLATTTVDSVTGGAVPATTEVTSADAATSVGAVTAQATAASAAITSTDATTTVTTVTADALAAETGFTAADAKALARFTEVDTETAILHP